VLNGADGLEHPTIFNCVYFYGVDRRKIAATLGQVTNERIRRPSATRHGLERVENFGRPVGHASRRADKPDHLMGPRG
jgi:hypothetical protein